MLPNHEFCDHCPGCRPAFIDTQTGKALAADSPTMLTVNAVWDNQTTYAERKAFISVTLHNSRAPDDMRLAQAVMKKIEDGLDKAR